MAIAFLSDTPKKLLTAFKKAIDDGNVTTWVYDEDGDFTHTTKQWRRVAWLRPSTAAGRLMLNILKPKDAKITWEVYGIYHASFIESMIIHCHDLFTNTEATTSPSGKDEV